MKKYLALAIIPLIAACSVVDPLYGTEEGTVVSVDIDGEPMTGCSVTFKLEGSEATYISTASTPRNRDQCKRLEAGMAVPVVADPSFGDYPYVLFEAVVG